MAITAAAGEYKSKIGLDSLYIAEVTVDTAATYTADTPEYFAPAAEASQEPSSSFAIQYADDQPYDVMTSEGETKISLKVTGIPIEMLAKITGRVFDAASGRMFDNGGTAPYIALSFRSKKANGSYRYYQFLKGKFDMPKEELATLGDTPEPKTLDLTFTAIRTVYQWDLGDVTDSVKRIVGDTDTTNFSATSWFSQVQTPSVSAPSALALSSSTPTDGATGISVSANQSLTFNNALNSLATSNIILVKASDGVTVAMATGYPSIDTARKVVTLDPNANLSAATAYIIFYSLTDIYGQTLSGAINFTTA
jgi:phi13 family phage major tail protein